MIGVLPQCRKICCDMRLENSIRLLTLIHIILSVPDQISQLPIKSTQARRFGSRFAIENRCQHPKCPLPRAPYYSKYAGPGFRAGLNPHEYNGNHYLSKPPHKQHSQPNTTSQKIKEKSKSMTAEYQKDVIINTRGVTSHKSLGSARMPPGTEDTA